MKKLNVKEQQNQIVSIHQQKPQKTNDLKNSLFQLFSGVGEVHEVHYKKNVRMKGQAFVVANDEIKSAFTWHIGFMECKKVSVKNGRISS